MDHVSEILPSMEDSLYTTVEFSQPRAHHGSNLNLPHEGDFSYDSLNAYLNVDLW
jgi:hypothetical protein